MPDSSIAWGRSELGCDGCDRPGALAGWEVKVDGELVAKLCTPCSQRVSPGKAIPRKRQAPVRRRSRVRQ